MKKAILTLFLSSTLLSGQAVFAQSASTTHFGDEPEEVIKVNYDHAKKTLSVNQFDHTAWLMLHDVNGNVVKAQQLVETTSELPLGDMAPGIYSYRFLSNTGKSVKGKFVIR